ncbi:hypothetical protein ACOBR2_03285 [Telmatobacter bradus]|uniref:hypothetical protein n=1 Tax=Telmatobacter bradus TaxID=474953 RepID=UPI003B43C08C
MAHQFGVLRRFRFNLPQRIAAVLLACFLAQGMWLIAHEPLSESDYRQARCGRETWEQPSALAGYYTSCGNPGEGILADRMAGLPLTLNLLIERGFDYFRAPENRVVQTADAPLSSWELRHQLPLIPWLLRLPFLGVGCMLGGCLWWVTRRLFGNLGGYTALGLFCFCPAMVRACVTPDAGVLALLGIYGGLYTCIGVAHAMQGPRRKWRPRIVLLTAIFAVAAGAHLFALALVAVLGLGFMLWVGEGRRGMIVPVVLLPALGALVALFALYGFSWDAFRYAFSPDAWPSGFSLAPARALFLSFAESGLVLALAAAFVLYAFTRRSRFFGNTVPLLSALVCVILQGSNSGALPCLWAVPFVLTFVAGVFADAYESHRPRLAIAAGAAVVALQVLFGLLSVVGLV